MFIYFLILLVSISRPLLEYKLLEGRRSSFLTVSLISVKIVSGKVVTQNFVNDGVKKKTAHLQTNHLEERTKLKLCQELPVGLAAKASPPNAGGAGSVPGQVRSLRSHVARGQSTKT